MPIRDVQTTNKQHAVPQNIMDVEFKIIGELTLRQFAYLIVFGGVAYITAIYMQGIFKWPVTVVSALLGFGLAFVPLQERGLDQWIVNFFLAIYSPNQKIWRKDAIAPAVFLYQNMAVVKQELITLAPTSSRRKLEEFLEHSELEKKEDRLDIPEKKYIQMVKDAFANTVTTTTVAPVQASPIVSAPLTEEIYVPPILQPAQLFEPIPVPEIPKEPQLSSISSEVTTPVPPVPVPTPVQVQVLKPEPVKPPVVKPQIPEQPELKFPGKRDSDMTMMPITPDRHSGRKFTSLLPKQGELILPIRGERMLKTSEETDIDKDIQEKTEQLNQLINQIKDSNSFRATPEKVVSQEPVKEQLKPTPPPSPPPPPPPQQPVIPPLPPAPAPKPLEDKSMLEAEVKSLKKELEISQQEKERIHPEVHLVQPSGATDNAGEKPAYINRAPLTNKPNVISGVVLNPLGVGLDNVVIIVKNDRNETIRAIKTNSIGLFTFVSPIANGTYKILVDEFHKSGSFFDIISLQAKGDIISPIEFEGRS